LRHPNVLRYLNSVHGRSQVYERRFLSDLLIEKLAPMFSEEGWDELMKLAEEATDKYAGKAPGRRTAAQEYGISLLPKSERAEKSRAVGA
jgi:hypothetical protein